MSQGDPVGGQPQKPPQRLAGIEILRGVAALSVVFHHSWSLGTTPRFRGYWVLEGFGTWGVSLFFLLSSYLLADAFWNTPREGRLRRFYTRRVFRIVPAYYLNILILFVFFASHDQLFSRQGLHQVAANATFTHFLFPTTASSLNVNGALWTLTVEACLYLAIPAMALFTKATRGLGAIALVVVGLGYRLYVALWGESLQRWYFPVDFNATIERLFLVRQFVGVLPIFGLGIAIRYFQTSREWRAPTLSSRTYLPVLMITLIPSILFLQFIEKASFYDHWVWFTGFDLVLSALLIPALLLASSPRTSIGKMSSAGVWLGERSYGLYLWHFPIVLSVYGRGPLLREADVSPWPAKLALILALSLLAAALSWRLVEEPLQAIARRRTSRRPPE